MPDRAFGGEKAITIFFSSVPQGESRDRKLREQLEQRLVLLRRSGVIAVWHDGKVSGSQKREQEIATHVEAAQIIVLLLSPEFLDSHFCYKQMLYAMERQKKNEAIVVPVFLRPCEGWQDSPFGKLEPLLDAAIYPFKPGKRPEWLAKAAEGLHALVESLSPPFARQTSPRQPIYRDIVSRLSYLPRHAVHRPHLIKEVYEKLSREDVTALILTGLGGTGKTTLAVQIALFVQEQQRAGQKWLANDPLWLDIDSATTLVDVIGSLSHVLGCELPPFKELTIKAQVEELFDLVNLADRLIVFDQLDAWLDAQTAQVSPEYAGVDEWLALLNIHARDRTGRVLFTSRFYPHEALQYPGYIQEYKVSGLNIEECIQLLHAGNCTALEGVTEKELSLLAEQYQGHAQALTWVRTLLERDASITIETLLQDSHYRDQRLGRRIYDMLDTLYTRQLTQDQRELLMAFAIYRRAVPFAAALEVAAFSNTDSQPGFALLTLLQMDLLQAAAHGCYRLHPVVNEFMQMHFEKKGKQEQMDAHSRAARHYQDQFQHILQHRNLLLDDTGLLDVVEAVWHLCLARQRNRAYQLIQETKLFAVLLRRGGSSTLLTLYLQLLAEEGWWPEPSLAGYAHNEMGEIRNALGQKYEALHQYEQALEFFRVAGQQDGIVEALNNLGAMHRVLQHDQQALTCYQEALRICEETPYMIAKKGTILNNLGRLVYEQGKREWGTGEKKQAQTHYREVSAYYEQALACYRESAFLKDEAITLNNLGEVYQALWKWAKARSYYWQALQRFQEHGDRRGEGMILNNLGSLYENLPDREENQVQKREARANYEQALRIFREVGDRWQEGIVLRNLGRFYMTCPQFELSERYRLSLACFILARNLFKKLHDTQHATIPTWVEKNLLYGLETQQFEALFCDVEMRAAQILEQVLMEDER